MATDAAAALDGTSVLVTGGAGFVGSHLASELAEVCDVTVLDDLSTGSSSAVPDGVTFVRGDVRDVDTVAEVANGTEVVFHQAALADASEAIRRPVEGHHRNASGTVAVLEAARRVDARVVLASSAAIYGHADSLPVHESDPKHPISPYGIDKAAADRYARVYQELYDLPTVVLRYFNVYGPRRSTADSRGVVGTFLDRARRDAPLVVHGDGNQSRDFVYVRDVVRANLLAATTERVGQAYNVGTGTAVSIRDVADHVREAVDSDSEVVYEEAREGDIRHSRAAVEKARAELGFDTQYDFADGVEAMTT